MVSFPYPLTIWWEKVGTMWGIIAQHLRLYKHHFPYFLWSPNLIPYLFIYIYIYITSPMLPGIPCTIHQLDTGELSKTSNTWTSMNPECNHKLWNATQARKTGLAKAPNKLELSWPTQLEIRSNYHGLALFPGPFLKSWARRQGPEIWSSMMLKIGRRTVLDKCFKSSSIRSWIHNTLYTKNLIPDASEITSFALNCMCQCCRAHKVCPWLQNSCCS